MTLRLAGIDHLARDFEQLRTKDQMRLLGCVQVDCKTDSVLLRDEFNYSALLQESWDAAHRKHCGSLRYRENRA